MQEGFYLCLHISEVGVFTNTEPRCVVSDAIEGFPLFRGPGCGDIRDDVRWHEEGAVEVCEYALDGAVRLIHLDDLAGLTTNLPGKGFADQDVILAYKILETSLQEVIFRKHLEEVGVSLDSRCLDWLFPALYSRLPEHRHVGRRFDFRNIHLQLLFVPIGQAKKVVITQNEGTLPVRRLVRNLILLHDIAADQNHECQAHGQPHSLYDRV